MEAEAMRLFAAALAIGLGSLGPALAIGILGFGALQALGRNPEARGPIMTNMILAIAMAEAIAIYALIIGIILAMGIGA
jgi:F-type H+-transporting ATPase subunit c